MDWEDRNPNMKGKKKRKANSYRKENGCKKRIVIQRKNKMDVNEVLGNRIKNGKQKIKESVSKKKKMKGRKKGEIKDGKKKREAEVTGWDCLIQVDLSKEDRDETKRNKRKRKIYGINPDVQGKLIKKKIKLGIIREEKKYREWDDEIERKEKEEDKHDKRKRKMVTMDKCSGKDVRKKRPKTGAEDIRKFFRTEDKH